MSRCTFLTTFVLSIAVSSSVAWGSFVLHASHKLVHRGDSRTMKVTLIGGFDPVQAVSFGLSHDPAVATLTEIELGTAIEWAIGPGSLEFFAVDLDPVGGTGGTFQAILSSSGAVTLPPFWPKQVARFVYDIEIGAPTGPSSLEFDSTLGNPAVSTEVQLADGASTTITPFTIDGRFTVIPGDDRTDGAGVLGQLWFLDGGDDTITVVGPDGAVLEVIPTGEETPVAIAVDPSGPTWVAFRDSNAVVRFDEAGNVLQAIPVDDQPVAIALDSEGNAWVSCVGVGALDKISHDGQILFGGTDGTGPTAGLIGAAIEVGSDPAGLAVDALDNVFVVCTSDATLTKVNASGGVATSVQLSDIAEPYAVAIDREGYAWITLRGLDRVEKRASDASLVESFSLPIGSRPEGITLRTGTEAWTYGSADGNLYRLRPGEPAVGYPGTGTPSGISADGRGSLWVTDRALDLALRFDGAGQLVQTVGVGDQPALLGDASGLVRVNVFFPDEDFDLDGFASGLEIDVSSDPLDPSDTPTLLPGFVEPVAALTCQVSVQTVSLSWTIPDPHPYESLIIHRDGAVIASLPGESISFVDPTAASVGPHTYEVTGESASGTSSVASCVIVVAQGQYLAAHTIEFNGFSVNLFGMTFRPDAPPGAPVYYFTDPGQGWIYGTDTEFQMLIAFPSPFAAAETPGAFGGGELSSTPTAGIAYRSDGDGGAGSLFVAGGSTGDTLQVAKVQEISLLGDPIGPAIILTSEDPVEGVVQIRGGLGGLAYHEDSGTLLAVGPDVCELYAFVPGSGGGVAAIAGAGGTPGMILPAASASHPIEGPALNGVYFPPFSEFGPSGGRVVVTSVAPTGEFQLVQLAIADGEATIVGDPIPLDAVESENSFGEFVLQGDEVIAVGLTTSTVYELGSAFFVRGDAQGNGSVDLGDAILILDTCFGDVPFNSCIDAYDVDDSGDLDIADAILLLNYLFTDGSPPPPPGRSPSAGPDPTPDPLPCL
ncbi:MAG: hypothetical protein KDC38_11585 [Planctomycetes bacterium]|nr:hypothetical protein [Planctomycetota bacterium]